ncbi:MAG: hypothetical protein V1913_05295 [Fibrobacterota bacterium]
MMKKHIRAAAVVAATLILELGCSKGGGTPLLPSNTNPPMESDTTGTYAGDSAAVWSLLDLNGYAGLAVSSVSDSAGGRIRSLRLPGSMTIRTIPAVVANLNGLRSFQLESQDFQYLPQPVYGFFNLETLWVHNTPIRALDAQISSWVKLKFLSMVNCSLSTLPAGIKFIPNLVTVDVTNNRLCNVTTDLATWLDARSLDGTGWRSRQDCANWNPSEPTLPTRP